MFEREKRGEQQQWKSSLNKWWHNINTQKKYPLSAALSCTSQLGL